MGDYPMQALKIRRGKTLACAATLLRVEVCQSPPVPIFARAKARFLLSALAYTDFGKSDDPVAA